MMTIEYEERLMRELEERENIEFTKGYVCEGYSEYSEYQNYDNLYEGYGIYED